LSHRRRYLAPAFADVRIFFSSPPRPAFSHRGFVGLFALLWIGLVDFVAPAIAKRIDSKQVRFPGGWQSPAP
jgi:hypothetical protein